MDRSCRLNSRRVVNARARNEARRRERRNCDVGPDRSRPRKLQIDSVGKGCTRRPRCRVNHCFKVPSLRRFGRGATRRVIICTERVFKGPLQIDPPRHSGSRRVEEGANNVGRGAIWQSSRQRFCSLNSRPDKSTKIENNSTKVQSVLRQPINRFANDGSRTLDFRICQRRFLNTVEAFDPDNGSRDLLQIQDLMPQEVRKINCNLEQIMQIFPILSYSKIHGRVCYKSLWQSISQISSPHESTVR